MGLCRMSTAEDEYQLMAALKGYTVLMWCNTSRSGAVNWTRRTVDGHFRSLYVNGSFESGRSVQSRYSIVQHGDKHSLRIYNAQIRDSGRYDCYERGDVRRFGYELNVTGKNTENNFNPFTVLLFLRTQIVETSG